MQILKYDLNDLGAVISSISPIRCRPNPLGHRDVDGHLVILELYLGHLEVALVMIRQSSWPWFSKNSIESLGFLQIRGLAIIRAAIREHFYLTLMVVHMSYSMSFISMT